MSLKQVVLWGVGILLQVQVSYLLVLEFNKKDDAVVDVQKVFSEFEMKKELESRIKLVKKRQTEVLDSLNSIAQQFEFDYQVASEMDKANINKKYVQFMTIYNRRKELMNEELTSAIRTYDEQIWNQLTAYMKDYGKNKEYRLVIGDYDKNVVYSSESINCTDELIEFVNLKYKGN
jgi:hypothetical protein